MASLNLTIGDFRQYQVAITKNGVPVDLTGIQELNFTLQQSGGGIFAQWGLGTGVTVVNPPSAGLGLLTVTPAMQAAWVVQNYSLLYTWSLIDEFGNPTQSVDSGPMTLTPPPQSALL